MAWALISHNSIADIAHGIDIAALAMGHCTDADTRRFGAEGDI